MSDDLKVLLRFLSDSSQARTDSTELRKHLGSEFGQISKLGEGAIKGISNEMAGLARQIPLVGQPLAGITRQMFNLGSAKKEVDGLSLAFGKFQTIIAQVAGGKNAAASDIFKDFGINAENALRNPRAAFAQFTDEFRRFPDAAGRAHIAAELFQADAIKLLPALEGTAKQAASASSNLASMALPLGIVAAGLVALAAASISAASTLFKISEAASEVGDEIYRAHLRTQLTSESLSGLRLKAQENKVGFDQLTSGLDRYLKNVDSAALGNQKLSHELSDLGINAQEAARSPQAAIEALVKSWSLLPPTTDRNAAAMTLMGKAGDRLIPIFDALHGSLTGAMKDASDLGQMWDEKTARQAHELQVAVADLSASWEGLKLAIGKEVFEEITFQIFRLTEAIKSNRDEVSGAAPDILQWIEIFLDATRRIADLIGGVLMTAFLALLTPLELVVLGLQAISNILIFIADWTVGWFPSIHRGLMSVKGEINDVANAFTNLFTSVNKGAGNLLAGTFSKSPFVGSLDDELAFDAQQRKRAEEEKARLRGGGLSLTQDDSKEREKARKEAERLAQEDAHARLKILEIASQAAQRIFQEETTAQQREYQARRISLETYLTEQEQAARRLRDVKLAELAEERKVVEQTIAKAAERKTRLAEIADKEAAAHAAYNQKLLADQFEIQQKIEEAAKAHSETLLAIAATRDQSLIAAIRAAGEKRIAASVETENAVIAVEQDALNRQREHLIEQLTLAGQNVDEQRKVNDDLAKLAATRANFEEEAVRRLERARLADLQSVRQYLEQLKALRQDISESELEAQRAEFENLKIGLLKREDIERLQAERAIQAEQDRFAAESELRRKIQEDRAVSLRNEVDFQTRRATSAIDTTHSLESSINDSIRIISNLELKIAEARKTLAQYEEDALKPDSTVSGENIDSARSAVQEAVNQLEQEKVKLDGARERLKIAREAELKARADANRSTDELRAVEAEGRKKDEDAVAKHTAKMQELEGQRDAVVITESKRILATRQELIQAEIDFEDRAIRLRHDRAVAHLDLERQDLEAQLRLMQRAVDEGKADEAQLRVIKGRIDEINRQIKAEDSKRDADTGINKKQGQIDLERADPSSNRSVFGDMYADTLEKTGSKVQALGATAKGVFEGMSADAGNMTSILSGNFKTLISGLGSTLEAFLVTGKMSGKALALMLTQTLAHLAIESGIKALYETAAGFASAAIYDYKAAAQHFTAATLYGEVALAAGAGALVSGIVARKAFGSDTASAASAQGVGAGGSGDGTQPGYRPFNYNSQTPSASQAFGEGSRSQLGGVLQQIVAGQQQVVSSNMAVAHNVAALHEMIGSIPQDEMIMRNRNAVGDAMRENYQSYHPVTQDTISLASRGTT